MRRLVRDIVGEQIGDDAAALDQARFPVADDHDRRAQRAVVLAAQWQAVGARRRERQEVALLQRRQKR